MKRKKTKGSRTTFTTSQISILILLTLAAILTLTGLGFSILQNEFIISELQQTATGISQLGIAPQEISGSLLITTTSTPMVPTALSTTLPTKTATLTPSATPALPTETATNPPTATNINTVQFLQTTIPSLTPIPSPTPAPEYWRSIIGVSVKGRPIEVHRFGNGHIERMIIAGIHGGYEGNTIALADELIDYFFQYPEEIPPDTSLFILRSLNPDGEARGYSPDARTNANGVDLNRNWDAGWKPKWSRLGCWNLRPTSGGKYPGSEPETQAAMQFLLTHNIDYLINYHSAALGIFPSGTPHHPESIRLAEAIGAITPYPYPPINTGCIYSGTLVDWALRHGIIGVDIELMDHVHTDFKINLDVLDLLLNWRP